ncbi:MAG TPA: FtsX-like permease family protein [Solirubrobacteraceae bacterium]|nr:FtsX-like permease family protein [Solirubrobacteraceae bacterium]
MKPLNVLILYRVRLRARLLQELFALIGIAAGVALLFASQVASSSLQSSVTQLSHGIAGNATLQLLAREPQGFPQSMLADVRHIQGVHLAAPILETSANAIGPRGSQPVQLIGVDSSLSELGGTLTRHLSLKPFAGIGAVVLPAPLAEKLGLSKFGQEVNFQLAGRTGEAPLYARLHESQIGPLIASPLAIAPLFTVQEMMGVSARVSRILVQASPGAQAHVRHALETLAAGRLNVEPIDYDEQLFSKAAAVSNQSTLLFAVISALVGFLFAFNAALFTVPQRRRLIVDLRRDGYAPQTVIAVLMVDALMLGVCATVLGLALGDELSIHFLHSNPAFLSLAFTVGSPRIIDWQTIAISIGGGMLAAIVAVLSPLLGILSRDPLAAQRPLHGPGSVRASRWQGLAGLMCLVAATAILHAAPDAAIPGMVMLLGALLLMLPIALHATLWLVRRLARRITSIVPHVASMELSAVPGRALAITATGAIAVFGSVAIQGAHGDLLAGLETAAAESNASTDVWVRPAGSYNLLQTTAFTPTDQAKLEHLPGVRAVHLYRSGFLDYGQRRLFVIAPSSQSAPLLPGGQLLEGNLQQATKRVRGGGWLVLSKAVAAEHHLTIGEAFTPPSANPTSFRVAALSTNLGWAPGAMIMNASDYARAWDSIQVSAYSILLDPGTTPAQAAGEIRHALGAAAQSGLSVQSAAQHAAQQSKLGHQALASLTEIATLILIAAVLAMAAAMGAMIWQRRPRLAKLKLEGLPQTELWQTMLLESVLLLGVGCAMGAVFGLYGQQLADRALADVVNFPVVYSLPALTALRSLALVIAGAAAILAIPGYFAASVPASLALQD